MDFAFWNPFLIKSYHFPGNLKSMFSLLFDEFRIMISHILEIFYCLVM